MIKTSVLGFTVAAGLLLSGCARNGDMASSTPSTPSPTADASSPSATPPAGTPSTSADRSATAADRSASAADRSATAADRAGVAASTTDRPRTDTSSTAAAQSDPASSADRDRTAASATRSTPGSQTITGCLNKGTSGSDFSLTDETGKQTAVSGSDLEKHAGHRVRLTGTLQDNKMQVASIEHIAASCEAKQ